MNPVEKLREILNRIDGRGYKGYKAIAGSYRFPDFELWIDHVQGDPFAAPSRLRVWVAAAQAGFPEALFQNDSRRIGLENCLALAVDRACRAASGRRGSGKSGLLAIDAPGQELLARTAVRVSLDGVEARLAAGLPAAGRRILGREAAAMLLEELPRVVAEALTYRNGDPDSMRRFAAAAEDADALRGQLAVQKLVAFVADGSRLPRRSGVDDRPPAGADIVPFQSPPSLRVEIPLPNRGQVTGMGIPAGVTLIVGGGFHGKSTLLQALERGVYNHRPDDGRELVVTEGSAVKIRAEDGRSVAGVDISPFINNLPQELDTRHFSTNNSSGSTSQAANIVEALELDSRLLLIDEDTAATNFMIRDRRMQALIASEKEPITPFVDRVRPLFDERGVSTILVMGGSGDYFDIADTVIAMEAFRPVEVTAAARAIAAREPGRVLAPSAGAFGGWRERVPDPHSIDPSRRGREVSVQARGTRVIRFGEEEIELTALSQLVDDSQARGIGLALVYARQHYLDGRRSLAEALRLTMADVATHGLDVLDRRRLGDLAAFRLQELGGALNRLRALRIQGD